MHFTYLQKSSTDFCGPHLGPSAIIPLLDLITLHSQMGKSKKTRLPACLSADSRWWRSTQRWLPRTHAIVWGR